MQYKFNDLYDRILESQDPIFHRKIIKWLNLGTIALVTDYLINSIRLSSPSILQNINNPLIWKILAVQGEHHIWNLLSVFSIYIILCIKIHKIGYRIYGVIALFFTYVIVSHHELLWWACYDVSHILWNIPFQTSWLINGAYWLPDLVTVIAFYYFYKRTHNKQNSQIRYNIPYVYLTFLGVIYVIWILIGFPITVDFLGLTQWYYNPYVNLFEILSWNIPIFAFLLTFKIEKPNGVESSTKGSTEIHPQRLTRYRTYTPMREKCQRREQAQTQARVQP